MSTANLAVGGGGERMFIRQLVRARNWIETALVRVEIEVIRWKYRRQNKKYQKQVNDNLRYN